MAKKPLLILTGPTAVGKTALSLRLAKAVDGEIISADSMQVYKGMDIGSAKIRPDEMDGVPHHLIDELEPDQEFHVVLFQELAKKYMDEIWERGHIPILVGGTGFYIQAVLYDIDFTENTQDGEYRRFLEELAAREGGAHLHEMLREVDGKAAQEIHENNIRRMIRALEFFHDSGRPISEHNREQRQKTSPYSSAYFVLNEQRQTLYPKIDRRVDAMMEAGLLEEVRALRDRGFTADMVSMKGLGYKELLAYLAGECSLEEAVFRIKRDSRHFAKRQITWFKRERDVLWLNREEFADEDAILAYMLEVLREREICG